MSAHHPRRLAWRHATLAAMVLVGAGCAQAEGDDAAAAGATPAAPVAAPARNVRIVEVGAQRFRQVRTYTGETAPWKTTTIAAEFAGRLVRLDGEVNDELRAGDTVAHLNADTADAEIQAARVQLEGAEARLRRAQKLRKDKLIAAAEVDDARTAVKAAKAALKSAKVRRGLARVKAPIGGIVTARHAEPGEYAAPGAPLLTLADLRAMKVIVHVPEDEIAEMREGMRLDVRIPSLPDLGTIAGEVSRVGFVGNRSNRTYPTEIRLENAALTLRVGMLAEADALVADVADAVVIPRDAVVDRPDGAVVYVVDAEVARERPVKVGASDGDRVRILAGLQPGDRLVIAGQRRLSDGDAVRVLAPLRVGAEGVDRP